MERRTFLTAVGGIGLTSVAGCLGGSDDEDAEEPDVEGETVEETGDGGSAGGDSEEIVLAGTGDTTTETFELDGETKTIEVRYSGDRFAAELYRNGERVASVVDEDGSGGGRYTVDVPEGEYKLRIEAEGEWEVVVANG